MEVTPSLAEKLARLAKLESEFQAILEAEKLESLAEFAAGAGHEINNPLTVISGRAQLLLREETDEERRHALALIVAQTKRVYEMIADMMLFARPPRPELQTVDLAHLADELVADLRPLCAEQKTSLYRTGETGPMPIEADPVQIGVALRAIGRNALEALGEGGVVEIGVGSSAEVESRTEGIVRIDDDGPGITPEHRRHFFAPYYSARQAGRGLGLGLSKAWRIVANHGGRIEVSSRPGGGTSFLVRLPCRP